MSPEERTLCPRPALRRADMPPFSDRGYALYFKPQKYEAYLLSRYGLLLEAPWQRRQPPRPYRQPSKAHRGQTTWSVTIAPLGRINHLSCPSTGGGRTGGRLRNENVRVAKNVQKDDAKHSGCIKFSPLIAYQISLMLSMLCRHFVRPIYPHA